MRAELGLPSVKGDDERGGGMTGGFGGSMGGIGGEGRGKRPINVKFEIPYFTTSGIQVSAFQKKKLQNGFTCLMVGIGALPQNHRAEAAVSQSALGAM